MRKKDRPNSKPGSEIDYVWQKVAKPVVPYYISMVACTLTSSSFEGSEITELRPGSAKTQVIAMSDNVRPDKLKFEIDVVGNEEILEDIEVPIVMETEDELLEYNPIEIYDDPMNQDYSVIKAHLDEKKKLIEEQQRRLNDQNTRIKKQKVSCKEYLECLGVCLTKLLIAFSLELEKL